MNEARRHSIPLIVIVDTDKQLAREVIDKYMERGYNWLFAEQVINYSTAFRTQSYEVACKAIRRAIEYCHANDTLTPKSKPTAIETTEQTRQSSKDDQTNSTAESTTDASTRPHDANVDADADAAEDAKQDGTRDAGGPLAALKKALLSVYGSAQAAFEALSGSDGVVGRRQWKKAIKKTSLPEDFGSKDLKTLRGMLPKVTSLSAFCSFMDDAAVESESTDHTDASGLAPLPPEVPSLPSSFRRREHAEAQLSAALLDGDGRRSTSLTAPKSRISSQGMGSCDAGLLRA